MYHTKKIALFISHIFGDYQKNVCQGVVDQASEYGYRTEVYTTSDGENVGTYGIGEAGILRIPNFDDFSGIVIASGTYPQQELKDQILKLLREQCFCPIIEITESDAIFPAISLENNLTTGTLTEHLIRVHGCRRICYLGCSSERFFSDRREQIYRNTMAEHALSVGAHDVSQCGYTQEEAAASLDFFTEQGSTLPDAVICYNDHMALLFMVAAVKKGYQIPKDFALVGCDALPQGQNIAPKLTTVSFPTYQLGTEAACQLMKRMRGEPVPDCTRVFAEPVIGESCGCSCSSPEHSVLFLHTLSERIADLEGGIFTSMRMTADFSHAADIDEGMELLAEYVLRIDHCNEFYVCLYADWDAPSGQIMELTHADETDAADADLMLLKLAVRNKKRLPECTFPKKTLLPEYINRDSSCVHIVSPLFFEEREFGYIVIAYEDNQVNYHLPMMHWILNVAQLLQNLCETKNARLMQAKLESIYMRDSLTELYNRNGCEYRMPLLLSSAPDDALLYAFVFDMDGLKQINETFGHDEGDFALRAVAHALRSAADDDSAATICGRLEDDMFCILSNRYDEETAASLVERVEQYLRNYNHLSYKPYTLSASCGYASAPCRPDIGKAELQTLIQEAGQCMRRFKTDTADL